jgi:hypothetical protein
MTVKLVSPSKRIKTSIWTTHCNEMFFMVQISNEHNTTKSAPSLIEKKLTPHVFEM